MSLIVEQYREAPPPGTAPDDFTVVAVMPTYNEADIIEHSIKHLVDQGIYVYLLDNHSTDETVDIAMKYFGKGLVGVGFFPKGERIGHDLSGMLTCVQEYAKHSKADWLIYHDADEYRESPWPGVSMRDALYYVDRHGYNCIDHTVINFKMTDNDFAPGTDFVKHFRHWDFGRHEAYFQQVKAWKNTKLNVDLVIKHGHVAMFKGMKIYPFKFLLRHYQFRTEQQAARKGYLDRGDGVKVHGTKFSGPNNHHAKYLYFVQNSDKFEIFDDSFYDEYLLERLTGKGIRKVAY